MPFFGVWTYIIACFAGEEVEIDDSNANLEQPAEDKPKNQREEVVKINLDAQGEEPQHICPTLTCQSSWDIHFLIFCRNPKTSLHGHMLDARARSIARQHKLHIKEWAMLVKQAPHNFKP